MFSEILRLASLAQDDGWENTALPSAKCPHRAPRRAGWRRTPYRSKQLRKRGKITFLPRFPNEHTDGGECGAHKKRRAPKINRAPENRRRQLAEIFVNSNSRKRQNRAFAFFTLQRGAAGGKVNVPRIYKRRAPNRAAQRKTPRLAVRRPAGLSSNHEILFHQLETKFVNPFIYSSQ